MLNNSMLYKITNGIQFNTGSIQLEYVYQADIIQSNMIPLDQHFSEHNE